MNTFNKKSIYESPKDGQGAYTKDGPTPTFKVEDILFDKQLKFVHDPHSYKISVCSRRAGKTVACAVDLIDTALKNPDSISLYITLSRNNAKKIIWPELLRLIRKYKLIPDKKMKEAVDKTELSLTFPNGAVIYCSGAKDSSEIEKFRGMAFKKVYIDECQSFRDYIRELIDDVLEAALLDYNGTLCLIGTPGAIPVGYFAEIAGVVDSEEARRASESWTHYSWTFFDNPHITAKSGKTHQELLQRVMRRRGVTVEDPTIQREYFGKWAHDSKSLWIRYRENEAKSHFDRLPSLTASKKYNYIMGIDLGFNDADAIAILAWSDNAPTTYLVEELVAPKQGLTELVEQIQSLRSKYEISKMVIDEGGLGKKLAEEMRRRHKLPVQPADKARKQETVEFMNDAIRTGRLKAGKASKFAQDCDLVEIDRDKSTPDRIRLSDRYHSDIIDAVIYAFKESPAYTYQAPPAPLKPGTPEFARAEEDRMFEAELAYFQEIRERERRFGGNFD